jgi:hypothetical protein
VAKATHGGMAFGGSLATPKGQTIFIFFLFFWPLGVAGPPPKGQTIFLFLFFWLLRVAGPPPRAVGGFGHPRPAIFDHPQLGWSDHPFFIIYFLKYKIIFYYYF